MKIYRPLFFLAGLLLVVGLACSALSGGTAPTQPPATQPPATQPPGAVPTDTEVAATDAPTQPATEAPAATAIPEGSILFPDQIAGGRPVDPGRVGRWRNRRRTGHAG